MYSDKTFLRNPSFFPSIEYTGLCMRFDQSKNGSSSSEDTPLQDKIFELPILLYFLLEHLILTMFDVRC